MTAIEPRGRSRRGSWCVVAMLVAAAALAGWGPTPALGSSTSQLVIQPGVPIVFGSELCTLGWIFDGPPQKPHSGKPAVYAATAGHCGSKVGDVWWLARSVYGPDGGTGMVLDAPVEKIGTVVYRAFDGTPGTVPDFSLIRLFPNVVSQVNAAMAGHPEYPTGVATTSDVTVGDSLQFSGHGNGFGATTQTQQDRVGLLTSDDGSGYASVGPVSPGDSGGPVVDVTDGGKALGLVDDLSVGAVETESGMTVQSLLKEAAKHGFILKLRTVH
jgi:hypothetical protein